MQLHNAREMGDIQKNNLTGQTEMCAADFRMPATGTYIEAVQNNHKSIPYLFKTLSDVQPSTWLLPSGLLCLNSEHTSHFLKLAKRSSCYFHLHLANLFILHALLPVET